MNFYTRNEVIKIYGEDYCSIEGGLQEKKYVFWDHCRCNEILSQQKKIVIAECGLGLALNLTEAYENWSPDSSIEFISIEKNPVYVDELFFGNKAFLKAYREIKSGWNHFYIEPTFIVHVFIGDVMEAFESFPKPVDCWFLDGFSPKNNEEMWSEELCRKVAKYTKPKGRLSTFSCAGLVKRNLKSSGFEISKVTGYGKKREMLIALKRE